jgi:hypothetical protein
MVGGWNWLWIVSSGIIGVEPSGSATGELTSQHQERYLEDNITMDLRVLQGHCWLFLV